MSHITMNHPLINFTSTTTQNSTLETTIQSPMMSSIGLIYKSTNVEPVQVNEAQLPVNSTHNSPPGEKLSVQLSENLQIHPVVQRKIPNSGIIRDRAETITSMQHTWTMDHETYTQWRQLIGLWLRHPCDNALQTPH